MPAPGAKKKTSLKIDQAKKGPPRWLFRQVAVYTGIFLLVFRDMTGRLLNDLELNSQLVPGSFMKSPEAERLFADLWTNIYSPENMSSKQQQQQQQWAVPLPPLPLFPLDFNDADQLPLTFFSETPAAYSDAQQASSPSVTGNEADDDAEDSSHELQDKRDLKDEDYAEEYDDDDDEYADSLPAKYKRARKAATTTASPRSSRASNSQEFLGDVGEAVSAAIELAKPETSLKRLFRPDPPSAVFSLIKSLRLNKSVVRGASFSAAVHAAEAASQNMANEAEIARTSEQRKRVRNRIASQISRATRTVRAYATQQLTRALLKELECSCKDSDFLRRNTPLISTLRESMGMPSN
jgi:hypothetical protein